MPLPEGRVGELVYQGRGYDHNPVGVAHDHIARHDENARAGDRQIRVHGNMAASEHGGVDGAPVVGQLERLQCGVVAHGAVGDDAGPTALLEPEGEDVADRPGAVLLTRLEHQYFAFSDRVDDRLLRVQAAAALLEHVLAQRRVAQRAGDPDEPQVGTPGGQAGEACLVDPSAPELLAEGRGGHRRQRVGGPWIESGHDLRHQSSLSVSMGLVGRSDVRRRQEPGPCECGRWPR